MSIEREVRANMFKEVESLYKTDEYLKEAVDHSIRCTTYMMDGVGMIRPIKRYENPCGVVLSHKTTIHVAQGYSGSRVCVLNFASFKNPGGGVRGGSKAQEESLCRSKTFYPCLIHRMDVYESHRDRIISGELGMLYNSDILYSKDVVILRDGITNELLDASERQVIDVITCAAPNVSRLKLSDDELRPVLEDRINHIFGRATAYKPDVLILGAFGCGVFRCPPKLVAESFKKYVDLYRYDFKAIEFAIYCSQSESSNYDAFEEVFGV